jgi:hypothetical protein
MAGDRQGWSSGPGTALVLELDGDGGHDGDNSWENFWSTNLQHAQQVSTRLIRWRFVVWDEGIARGLGKKERPTGTMAIIQYYGI